MGVSTMSTTANVKGLVCGFGLGEEMLLTHKFSGRKLEF